MSFLFTVDSERIRPSVERLRAANDADADRESDSASLLL